VAGEARQAGVLQWYGDEGPCLVERDVDSAFVAKISINDFNPSGADDVDLARDADGGNHWLGARGAGLPRRMLELADLRKRGADTAPTCGGVKGICAPVECTFSPANVQ
jgi:hypothetical protein